MSLSYQEISERLESSFWTKDEFNEMLSQYADSAELKCVSFEVSAPEWEKNTYGQELPEQPKMNYSVDGDDSSIRIQCRIWSEKAVKPQIQENLSNIIRSYLHLPCTSECLLPFYGTTNIDKKCNATLHRFLGQNQAVAVFMVDLDHFKEVNDQYNHDIGSSVITQFGSLLQQQCQESAIAIHRSGDEFFILMPYDDVSAPLHLAYRISATARTYPYRGVEGIKLTAAQGICLCKDDNITFKIAAEEAEKAYYPKGKNQGKNRDTVRIVCPNTTLPPRGEENRKKAFAIVKSNLKFSNLFLNPYLDFLSSFVANLGQESDIQTVINDVIEWLNPTKVTGMQMLGKTGKADYQCAWSRDELAFALFHGLSQNNIIGRQKELELNFYEETDGFSIVLDSTTLYQYGETPAGAESESFSLRLPKREASQYETRTVILVQIGYHALPIPESCFYRVIRIDARPTIGGNLPDFWEAALSELIELLSEHSFLRHIIVCGKKEHGEIFCDVLKNSDQWGKGNYSYTFLAKKIRQPIERIQACQERLKNAVQFIDDDNEQLISAIVSICQIDKWYPCLPNHKSDDHRRFLKRSLSYEKVRLGIQDGCIVDTLEEAFPTTLEILRNCPDNLCLSCIHDQAGRELRELPNFKVVIKKPNSKHVPEYYEEDQHKLENYYQSVLGNDDAFFQKHLKASGQYDAVLKHIIRLISADGLQYATRRAILVVPHIISDPNDITPLGLISVYIAPRIMEGEVVFDFSFTWRTVEAVVGFPYSLYGSIRYAEQILETVRQECDKIRGMAERLKMGSVSYLAYSLHMFLDNSYLRIVRGIINDATP